jgi:hypothetical protein
VPAQVLDLHPLQSREGLGGFLDRVVHRLKEPCRRSADELYLLVDQKSSLDEERASCFLSVWRRPKVKQDGDRLCSARSISIARLAGQPPSID